MKNPKLSGTAETDPARILRYRDGLYAIDLLAAAICGLDFFTWLAAHPSGKEQICQSLSIHERPADVMLTLFTAMGLVRQQNGVFEVTETGREFLTKDSFRNLIPYFEAMDQRPVCRDMLRVLRTDKAANWASDEKQKAWTEAMEQKSFAKMFTAAMDCRGRFLGPFLATKLDLRRHNRLLDIAGGSGIYACALAVANPHLKAMVLEKPPVDSMAREAIAEYGLSERIEVAVRDMFKDALPAGHDAHLFSNVLHDWDVPVVRQLVSKSFAALLPGGMIIIHDAHLNAEKTGPLPVAEYSALLMNVSEGRCYSTAEISSYLCGAGFEDVTYADTAADRSVITARKGLNRRLSGPDSGGHKI